MEHCFIEKKALEKFCDVISLGDKAQGFKLTDLATMFGQYLTNQEQQINIILNLHGSIKENTYYVATSGTYRDQDFIEKKIAHVKKHNRDITQERLERYKLEISIKTEIIEARELISALADVSKNIPLKIFALCCYGENFLDFINLLPSGSFVITTSNRDTTTACGNLFNKKTENILSNLFNKEFKLEYLLEAFLLSQVFQQNTPKIGIKTIKGETITIDIADYAQNLFPEKNKVINFSPTFTEFLQENNLEKDYVTNELLQLGQGNKKIEDHKTNEAEYQQIVKFRQPLNLSGNIEEVTKLIKKHYPFISDEEISTCLKTEPDELQLARLLSINPSLLASLVIMDSTDFNASPHIPTSAPLSPIYNVLLAAAGDIIVEGDYVNNCIMELTNT